MIPSRYKENKSYKKQEVIYAEKNLALVMITKIILKSETIIIILKNIEELLILFVT